MRMLIRLLSFTRGCAEFVFVEVFRVPCSLFFFFLCSSPVAVRRPLFIVLHFLPPPPPALAVRL